MKETRPMNEGEYRREGRYVTAIDIASRLMPDLDMNEALLWPPDLFAYTSYLLLKTSAYQLVVSPPSHKQWPPSNQDINRWLYEGAEANYDYWFTKLQGTWGTSQQSNFSPIKERLDQWKTKDWKFSQEQKLKRAGTNKDHKIGDWEYLVREAGTAWRNKLIATDPKDFKSIDDCDPAYEDRRGKTASDMQAHKQEREKELFRILLNNTPPLLLSCWTFFYKQICDGFDGGFPLQISELLCNQDHVQFRDEKKKGNCDGLWDISQALLTMHAIADVASEGYGLKAHADGDAGVEFANKLLIGRIKYNKHTEIGGSLSTFNIERCRVLPKRHNPEIGITLRSLASNLAFHQSAVDVVWRQTANNTLGDRFIRDDRDTAKKTFSMLLLPFPLSIRTRDFHKDTLAKQGVIKMADNYGLFRYDPLGTEYDKKKRGAAEVEDAIDLVLAANEELADTNGVDIILFPETSLSVKQFSDLQTDLLTKFSENHLGFNKAPSIIIAGVRETPKDLSDEMRKRAKAIKADIDPDRSEDDYNFCRNAVYCQYLDKKVSIKTGDQIKEVPKYYNEASERSQVTPKYKQYKHHRWRLEETQIQNYGLSSALDPKKIWWESIKIPKRRVSFLNVGDQLTISHLICEDLARQDPIAELVRNVGPSLVVALLMDGPQLSSRWSSRYATVLSDDPGCSVITLTSLGMVKRHQTHFGLTSRVIALWNDGSSGHSREIELAQGAKAVLLSLYIDEEYEKTADGREEKIRTSAIRLRDVIQIYKD